MERGERRGSRFIMAQANAALEARPERVRALAARLAAAASLGPGSGIPALGSAGCAATPVPTRRSGGCLVLVPGLPLEAAAWQARSLFALGGGYPTNRPNSPCPIEENPTATSAPRKTSQGTTTASANMKTACMVETRQTSRIAMTSRTIT